MPCLQMDYSVDGKLSEADKQLVINCASQTFQAMTHESTNLTNPTPRRGCAKAGRYQAAVEHLQTISAINIACLWFDSPQVGACLIQMAHLYSGPMVFRNQTKQVEGHSVMCTRHYSRTGAPYRNTKKQALLQPNDIHKLQLCQANGDCIACLTPHIDVFALFLAISGAETS